MVLIIRSITNNTPYTLTLKVPTLEQNLAPITVASHATLDLLSAVTEDDLIAMQLYLNGMVSRGNLTVAATIDTSSFESGYTNTFSAANFAIGEVPSGAINSSNVTFTLAHVPVANTDALFLNGLRQKKGISNDYTISGATITFNTAPMTGSVLLADYIM
jgi:hypothetical protein